MVPTDVSHVSHAPVDGDGRDARDAPGRIDTPASSTGGRKGCWFKFSRPDWLKDGLGGGPDDVLSGVLRSQREVLPSLSGAHLAAIHEFGEVGRASEPVEWDPDLISLEDRG